MIRYLVGSAALASGLVLVASAQVLAGTTTIDFDDLATGTEVTTQYDGVTFSAAPQSCSGKPAVNMVIVVPHGGTASGAKALGITTGCPDFSPDYLRMVFTQSQQEVSFMLGDAPGTYRVRAYSTDSGGAPISTQSIALEGSGYIGVLRYVSVTSATGSIKRIEIEEIVGLYETIDNLTFACPDTTPPDLQISAPAFEACECHDTVGIYGLACDPEGYDHDQLEFLPVNAPAGTAWTLIGTAGVPQCDPGEVLYFWNATAVSDGCYYLKLTGWNECGDHSVATTVVCLDRSVDKPIVRSPAEAAIVAGVVPIDGTVWEGPNSTCLDHYTADYRASGTVDFSPVNPATPTYTSPVANDPLASWNTRNPELGVTDGKWQVRVRATNTCGAAAEEMQSVTVDNTSPTVAITDPLNCRIVHGLVTIRGTVTDAHLSDWTLQYTGGGANEWVTPPIASGHAAIVNGVLGTWDTRALPRCAYTLRLLATDRAIVDGVSTIHNQAEYLVSVYAGALGRFDYDGDGDVDLDDFGVFQLCQTGPGVLAPLECRD